MSGRHERGFALVAALLVATIVSAAAVALALEQELAIRRLSNVLAADRATHGARDLEIAAGDLLRHHDDARAYDGLEQAWATTELAADREDQHSTARLVDAEARFNLTNLAGDPHAGGAPPGTGGNPAQDGVPPGTAAESGPASETGGLDAALQTPAGGATPTPATPGAAAGAGPLDTMNGSQLAELRLRQLCAALEIDSGIVQAILDWVDADTDSRFPNGAEDDYYLNQSPAYRAANRPFVSPEELLLVRGVTPEIYARLAPFVVALPKATPINVNTAPPEVLMSLGNGIDRATANLLVEARKTAPFVSIEEFQHHPLLLGREIPAADLSVATDYFELGTVTVGPTTRYHTRSLLARLGDRATAVRRSKGYFDE
ncbi:MAG: type II secretion system minor pseudopilin GspK [Gammaproteobacteria bacterium]|nr:type II secretion system minor pseudopilin GspK [Gammaproteobacteria bacterium]